MGNELPGTICSGGPKIDETADDLVRQKVREGYAEISRKGVFTTIKEDTSCVGSGGGCCGPTTFDVTALAQRIGYSTTDLINTPASANMGLSCGNPSAIASLQLDEVVLDLGSGGGFDAFIASPKVGPGGKVIGVDMTPEMISKARRNAVEFASRTGLSNVEFRLGEIEHLPVADSSIDVVISNCVLNLSPNKPQVWREVARVLKPGGRVAISDLALLKPLPEGVLQMIEALVGCVAGAALMTDLESMVKDAGLQVKKMTSKAEYIEAMTSWDDPLYKNIVAALPIGSKTSDYITSLDIEAVKLP